MRPIHLPFFTGERLQLQEGFSDERPQPRNGTSQLNNAAAISAITNHLIDPRGAQSGMLIQDLSDVLDEWVNDGSAQRLWSPKPVRLYGVAHGVRMNVQLTSDSADLPMISVIVASNLRSGFGRNHQSLICVAEWREMGQRIVRFCRIRSSAAEYLPESLAEASAEPNTAAPHSQMMTAK
jgi:hypothetical protein